MSQVNQHVADYGGTGLQLVDSSTSSPYLSELKLPVHPTKPWFFSVMETLLHHKSTQSMQESAQHLPCHLLTLTPWSKWQRWNLNCSLNITLLHMFRLQCKTKIVKGEYGKSPDSIMRLKIGGVQSQLSGRKPIGHILLQHLTANLSKTA